MKAQGASHSERTQQRAREKFCAALTYMYRGFSIQTINYPPGQWHAHVERDGAGFTTLPSSRRFEWEAYGDAERKVDDILSSEKSLTDGMEEVWQTNS